MIIDNFNIVDVPVASSKTDTPLPVDANAVLTFTVPVQSFKMIARRNPQGLQIYDRLKHIQFTQSDPLYGSKLSARSFRLELLSFFAFIAYDHRLVLF